VFLWDYLSFDSFAGIFNQFGHAAFNAILNSLFGLVLSIELALSYVLEQGMCRYYVSFFKFSIVLTISLDSIVCQLHEYLFIQVDVGIIIAILLRASSYVALSELIDFTIRRV